MAYNNSDAQIQLDVLAGRRHASELPSQQRAKAERDQARAELEKSGRKEEVYRDVPGHGRIAVPQSVLDQERGDPEHRQRVYVETIDRQGFPWSGWQLPAPPKPARVLEAEEYFKVPYKWDPITSQYIKQVIHQKPPWMQRVDDGLAADDNRRSRYSFERES